MRTRSRAEAARCRDLFESAPYPIIIFRRDRLTRANPKALRLFGFTRQEMTATPLTGLFPTRQPDGTDSTARIHERMEAALAGWPQLFEWRWKRRDGSLFEADASLARAQWEGRRSLQLIVRVRDPCSGTEEVPCMWEGLLRARKMEAISRLAGGIAHDFNNLLTSIVGYTGLLKLGRSDDKTRGAVDGIESAAYRAADLIRKLMAFSRRQHLRARLVDLNDLIRGMQGSLKELLGDSVTMSMRLTSEPGWARADPALLQQAINAIAANAREAMTQGGTLSIETGTLVLGASHFPGRSNEPTGVWLVLSFADTGEGMDAAVASRLFEPYFTTREFGKGAGLGLATAYGIVEQSGGHIDAQSAPGQGTTIRIYLPRVEVSDSRLEPAPPC